jgi:hypothetical protein
MPANDSILDGRPVPSVDTAAADKLRAEAGLAQPNAKAGGDSAASSDSGGEKQNGADRQARLDPFSPQATELLRTLKIKAEKSGLNTDEKRLVEEITTARKAEIEIRLSAQRALAPSCDDLYDIADKTHKSGFGVQADVLKDLNSLMHTPSAALGGSTPAEKGFEVIAAPVGSVIDGFGGDIILFNKSNGDFVLIDVTAKGLNGKKGSMPDLRKVISTTGDTGSQFQEILKEYSEKGTPFNLFDIDMKLAFKPGPITELRQADIGKITDPIEKARALQQLVTELTQHNEATASIERQMTDVRNSLRRLGKESGSPTEKIFDQQAVDLSTHLRDVRNGELNHQDKEIAQVTGQLDQAVLEARRQRERDEILADPEQMRQLQERVEKRMEELRQLSKFKGEKAAPIIDAATEKKFSDEAINALSDARFDRQKAGKGAEHLSAGHQLSVVDLINAQEQSMRVVAGLRPGDKGRSDKVKDSVQAAADASEALKKAMQEPVRELWRRAVEDLSARRQIDEVTKQKLLEMGSRITVTEGDAAGTIFKHDGQVLEPKQIRARRKSVDLADIDVEIQISCKGNITALLEETVDGCGKALQRLTEQSRLESVPGLKIEELRLKDTESAQALAVQSKETSAARLKSLNEEAGQICATLEKERPLSADDAIGVRDMIQADHAGAKIPQALLRELRDSLVSSNDNDRAASVTSSPTARLRIGLWQPEQLSPLESSRIRRALGDCLSSLNNSDTMDSFYKTMLDGTTQVFKNGDLIARQKEALQTYDDVTEAQYRFDVIVSRTAGKEPYKSMPYEQAKAEIIKSAATSGQADLQQAFAELQQTKEKYGQQTKEINDKVEERAKAIEKALNQFADAHNLPKVTVAVLENREGGDFAFGTGELRISKSALLRSSLDVHNLSVLYHELVHNQQSGLVLRDIIDGIEKSRNVKETDIKNSPDLVKEVQRLFKLQTGKELTETRLNQVMDARHGVRLSGAESANARAIAQSIREYAGVSERYHFAVDDYAMTQRELLRFANKEGAVKDLLTRLSDPSEALLREHLFGTRAVEDLPASLKTLIADAEKNPQRFVSGSPAEKVAMQELDKVLSDRLQELNELVRDQYNAYRDQRIESEAHVVSDKFEVRHGGDTFKQMEHAMIEAAEKDLSERELAELLDGDAGEDEHAGGKEKAKTESSPPQREGEGGATKAADVDFEVAKALDEAIKIMPAELRSKPFSGYNPDVCDILTQTLEANRGKWSAEVTARFERLRDQYEAQRSNPGPELAAINDQLNQGITRSQNARLQPVSDPGPVDPRAGKNSEAEGTGGRADIGTTAKGSHDGADVVTDPHKDLPQKNTPPARLEAPAATVTLADGIKFMVSLPIDSLTVSHIEEKFTAIDMEIARATKAGRSDYAELLKQQKSEYESLKTPQERTDYCAKLLDHLKAEHERLAAERPGGEGGGRIGGVLGKTGTVVTCMMVACWLLDMAPNVKDDRQEPRVIPKAS